MEGLAGNYLFTLKRAMMEGFTSTIFLQKRAMMVGFAANFLH